MKPTENNEESQKKSPETSSQAGPAPGGTKSEWETSLTIKELQDEWQETVRLSHYHGQHGHEQCSQAYINYANYLKGLKDKKMEELANEITKTRKEND